MGATDFTLYRPGSDLQTVFRAAKEEARAEHGHQQGYSGDIQTKAVVALRRADPMTLAEAETFIYGTGAEEMDDGDLERASRNGPCLAVPIRRDDNPVTVGFMLYGIAPL
jgi:hypothetical protein